LSARRQLLPSPGDHNQPVHALNQREWLSLTHFLITGRFLNGLSIIPQPTSPLNFYWRDWRLLEGRPRLLNLVKNITETRYKLTMTPRSCMLGQYTTDLLRVPGGRLLPTALPGAIPTLLEFRSHLRTSTVRTRSYSCLFSLRKPCPSLLRYALVTVAVASPDGTTTDYNQIE
jgi:hypothetical protein